jgi:hypothetical protein
MKAPPPSTKARHDLLRRLQRQVDALHGKDDSGDRYAHVEVHDRRDGTWPYIRPVPRVPFEDPTPEQLLAAVDAAGSNVESTSRNFDQVRRDVQFYFEKDKRGRGIRTVAKKILGETAIVGQAYERHDDAPRWCRWEPYKKLHAYGAETPKLQTCFFNDVNQFDLGAFKKWLVAGQAYLKKAFGKQVKGWYVRTDGSIGTSLSALVETPEAARPRITALNRAKREFLEENAEHISARACRIEAEIRAEK